MRASLTFHDKTVVFDATDFEEHIHRVGKKQVIIEKVAKIYDEEEGRSGGDFRHFIFTFDALEKDKRDALIDIYTSYPKVADPAILEVEGEKHAVVFSPIQEACDFSKYVIDEETGEKFYEGSLVLLEIKKM